MRSTVTDQMLSALRSRDDKLCADAADEIERLHEHIKKLERRIHNQRRSCRENWEIVEMRRRWTGSVMREAYERLWKRHKELIAKQAEPKASKGGGDGNNS